VSGAWDGQGWHGEQVQHGARRLPEQWSIRLLYPRPPKGLSANDRTHWSVKHANTQSIRHEVFTKVRAAKVPALERIRVEVIWWVRDHRRRDVDNVMPFAKAIYDGVASDRGVSARIVDDDTPHQFEKVMPRIEYLPGGDAHFEVRITDLGDAL